METSYRAEMITWKESEMCFQQLLVLSFDFKDLMCSQVFTSQRIVETSFKMFYLLKGMVFSVHPGTHSGSKS